jgi:hypothetical protein
MQMPRRVPNKARLELAGDVLKLLRQRRRAVESVIIHPDATIEVRLAAPSDIDVQTVSLADELARWDKIQGYD